MENFQAFKAAGVDYFTGMVGCLKGGIMPGWTYRVLLDELESKIPALKTTTTREEWRDLVEREINPLLQELDRELRNCFDLSIGYFLEGLG